MGGLPLSCTGNETRFIFRIAGGRHSNGRTPLESLNGEPVIPNGNSASAVLFIPFLFHIFAFRRTIEHKDGFWCWCLVAETESCPLEVLMGCGWKSSLFTYSLNFKLGKVRSTVNQGREMY
ncbi:hypothetical protein KQX54_003871 [Cotesia glomerata]|uniref:Uncharacterized protein n=1 Tax=Cotesia glomerata TaxID=32391 RepID=A0AAV7HV06_COTGL|nr:hypothetical protein KQX54_003871 [Cotesia glomerata]